MALGLGGFVSLSSVGFVSVTRRVVVSVSVFVRHLLSDAVTGLVAVSC